MDEHGTHAYLVGALAMFGTSYLFLSIYYRFPIIPTNELRLSHISSEAFLFFNHQALFLFTCHGFKFQFRERPLKLGPARPARHCESHHSRHGIGDLTAPPLGDGVREAELSGAEAGPKGKPRWSKHGELMGSEPFFWSVCVCFLMVYAVPVWIYRCFEHFGWRYGKPDMDINLRYVEQFSYETTR